MVQWEAQSLCHHVVQLEDSPYGVEVTAHAHAHG